MPGSAPGNLTPAPAALGEGARHRRWPCASARRATRTPTRVVVFLAVCVAELKPGHSIRLLHTATGDDRGPLEGLGFSSARALHPLRGRAKARPLYTTLDCRPRLSWGGAGRPSGPRSLDCAEVSSGVQESTAAPAGGPMLRRPFGEQDLAWGGPAETTSASTISADAALC